MQQWREPTLLVKNPITEYFRTVTPYVFKAMHWLLDLMELPSSPGIRVRIAHFFVCLLRCNQQRLLAEKVDH